MEITCLCKYNGMSKCIADNWTDQKAGCSFAKEASIGGRCIDYWPETGMCKNLGAQKIALENHKG